MRREEGEEILEATVANVVEGQSLLTSLAAGNLQCALPTSQPNKCLFFYLMQLCSACACPCGSVALARYGKGVQQTRLRTLLVPSLSGALSRGRGTHKPAKQRAACVLDMGRMLAP